MTHARRINFPQFACQQCSEDAPKRVPVRRFVDYAAQERVEEAGTHRAACKPVQPFSRFHFHFPARSREKISVGPRNLDRAQHRCINYTAGLALAKWALRGRRGRRQRGGKLSKIATGMTTMKRTKTMTMPERVTPERRKACMKKLGFSAESNTISIYLKLGADHLVASSCFRAH